MAVRIVVIASPCRGEYPMASTIYGFSKVSPAPVSIARRTSLR